MKTGFKNFKMAFDSKRIVTFSVLVIAYNFLTGNVKTTGNLKFVSIS